jgi:hypothetical protein
MDSITWQPRSGESVAIPFSIFFKRITTYSPRRLAGLYSIALLVFASLATACYFLTDLKRAPELRTGLIIAVAVALAVPAVLLIFCLIPFILCCKSSSRVEIGKNGVWIGGIAFAVPEDRDVNFKWSPRDRQLRVHANGSSVDLKLPEDVRPEDVLAALEARFGTQCAIE